MTSSLRLILFDCDGTIVDSAETIVRSFTEGFRAAGAEPPPRADILSVVGLSLHRAVKRLAEMAECDPQTLADGYSKAYRSIAETTVDPLFPGILDVMDSVHCEATLMGIVTGKSRRGLERVMRQHGFGHRFVTTQSADDAPSKPAPDMVEQAMREAGVGAARTVVIGDTTYDIEMARNADAHAIGVDWGHHPTDALNEAGAHAVVTSMDELERAIERLVPRA